MVIGAGDPDIKQRCPQPLHEIPPVNRAMTMDRGFGIDAFPRQASHRLLACLLSILAISQPGLADEQSEPEAESADVVVFREADLEFFEKQVRPILARRCYECHSGRAKELKGGLRLDSRDAILVGGDTGPAIVPGDQDESVLIDAINYGELYQMPPKSKLPNSEIAILSKWVKLGAPWPPEESIAVSAPTTFDLAARKRDHWCWQPLNESGPPVVANQTWPVNAIDWFILAKLKENGLSPAPLADKRVLIRRAYFDLIGLPPPVDDVQAFVDDTSSQAFERVVDQLLESQHFGERWARHWMDLMRYAETHGHEFDYPIHHAAKYRDYLIRALNEDVPYDQFVREHLAGDLLVSPRRNPTTGANESILGTGFWFLGEATHAPVDVMGDQAGRLDNQIDVMTKAFLGLTVACARCHDHKFDAIATADYYALTGFLKSSHREQVLLDPGQKISKATRQLDAFRRTGDAIIASSVSDLSAELFTRYLLAAREVMYRDPQPAVKDSRADRVLFEDFEGSDYGTWKATGTAFGSRPQLAATTPAYQGDLAAHGKQWVNSHETRPGGDTAKGDSHTGTLTSPVFTIQRRFIEFLVGGGNHQGKTCINLLVNGTVVRTQTGFNSNRMRPARFEVSEFMGAEARLEIVDQKTGGWGNIGVDHIVFSGTVREIARLVTAVAAEFDLKEEHLRRWVDALSHEQVKQTSHPLYAWSVLSTEPTKQSFDRFRARLVKQEQVAAKREQDYPLLTDFSTLEHWHGTGLAFGAQPAPVGQWDPQHQQTRLQAADVLDSGHRGARQQGVLRSPTFTLTHKNLYYRVRGQGAKIRLEIDGYYMDTFNGLLFKGFEFGVKSPDAFTWHRQSQDVARYMGHRGHIKVIDHGDGFVAIDEIRMSDLDRPPQPLMNSAANLVTADVESLDDLAGAYGGLWATAGKSLQGESESPNGGDLLEWAFERNLVPSSSSTKDRLRELQEQWSALAKSLPHPEKALGIVEGSAETGRVYIRGNHRTQGDEVPRQSLTALVGRRPIGVTGSGRLELAEQILEADNPLITRVMVNRLWHHLFGRGIVASVDNFGVLGSRPTHPELLDFLARTFRDDGWSVKQMLRMMMLSRTYQMASTPNENGTSKDPDNLLLHRMRIRRLQGEAIRDAILAISQRLDRKVYGASVPVNITAFMQGRGRPKKSGPLDGNGRRSVYIEIRRNFLSPMMMAFDAPIPFNTVGRRNVSNVPAQALIMMNDPFVVAQSQLWAEQTLRTHTSTEARIESLYVTAFARPPEADEMKAAVGFLGEYRQQLGAKDADDIRAWASLCHVLINVKEFVFIY
jgi:hypothetical protein